MCCNVSAHERHRAGVCGENLGKAHADGYIGASATMEFLEGANEAGLPEFHTFGTARNVGGFPVITDESKWITHKKKRDHSKVTDFYPPYGPSMLRVFKRGKFFYPVVRESMMQSDVVRLCDFDEGRVFVYVLECKKAPGVTESSDADKALRAWLEEEGRQVLVGCQGTPIWFSVRDGVAITGSTAHLVARNIQTIDVEDMKEEDAMYKNFLLAANVDVPVSEAPWSVVIEKLEEGYDAVKEAKVQMTTMMQAIVDGQASYDCNSPDSMWADLRGVVDQSLDSYALLTVSGYSLGISRVHWVYPTYLWV